VGDVNGADAPRNAGDRGAHDAMTQSYAEQRIPPLRGLIPVLNAQGRPYAMIDLKRWIHLASVAHKIKKADLLAPTAQTNGFGELIEYARAFDIRVSLRTDCSIPPENARALTGLDLLDVMLCPASDDAPFVDEWFAAAHNAGLRVRLQLPVAAIPDPSGDGFAERLRKADVADVNFVVRDPFQPSTQRGKTAAGHLAKLAEMAPALEKNGIEVNIIGAPFCAIDKALWPNVVNSRQFFLDHQHYQRENYELAKILYKKGPIICGKIILALLRRHTVQVDLIDERLLPWLLWSPWKNARMAAWRKLTRHLRFFRSAPKAVEETAEALEREMQRLREAEAELCGPVCSTCYLRRICDRRTPEFRKAAPGVAVAAQKGEDLVASPLHFSVRQHKYFDAIDQVRYTMREGMMALAHEANLLLVNRPSTRLLTSADYGVDKTYYDPMEGGVRWFSVNNSEKRSTSLGRFQPPFTLSFMVAGGIAEYVGYSVGRHARLLCPMEAFRHEITLHVDADGNHVLLRDGKAVRPMEFEGAYYTPLRIGGLVEPRIALWNIDGNIVTQAVRVWEGDGASAKDVERIRFSFVTVCTRYARRLQAMLRSIVHQRGVDLSQIEIIIGYVPGLDGTDDLLDSIHWTFPKVRLLRAPFPQERTHSKGYMINEACAMASGEWVILLDADTMLPPQFLALVDQAGPATHFIATDGRKLLEREVTARILLGEIDPWDHWDELLQTPGEYRQREAKGIPIGFCQAVRRSCFEKVKYNEFEHFETADMDFAVDIRREFGLEKRLDGVIALHLDHGGSRWYGTLKHF